ncbi:MAG: C39 family peptidase [Clostridia bacterium]
MKSKRLKILSLLIILIIFTYLCLNNKNNNTNENIETEEIKEKITTYSMSNKEIEELPSKTIEVQSEEDEESIAKEQAVEGEAFEEQGEIAYNGTIEYPNVKIGSYKGLTYYSQIDNRWKSQMYSAINNKSQTIGTSGCGPTAAAMIVTAVKGTITPPEMADLFLKYGYRSKDQGTYWSAFRFVADTFDIKYQETSNVEKALELLNKNNYIVASCGNGLFTTGGHFVVLTKLENGIIEIYDPYLYSGKFDTSTRRGKVEINGNKVYISIENFIKYANTKRFFCYTNEGKKVENNQPVTIQPYIRYVTANIGLNIRNKANGDKIGILAKGTKVLVYETNNGWSRIGNGQWVYSNYLGSLNNTQEKNNVPNSIGKYKINANLLNVRTGPGTNYKIKRYTQLTANARNQNKILGNYYANGLKRGVVVTVTKIQNGFGLIPSGWISLKYCNKV